MNSEKIVSTSRFIPVAPSVIFDLLADARKHWTFDGSGSVLHVRKAPPRLYLGAKFSMDMKLGLRYFTVNKVVVFEEDKGIAWHHWAQFTWRYDLEEVPGGTNVNESFDFDKPWSFVITRSKKDQSNLRDMKATLERIEQLVTA